MRRTNKVNRRWQPLEWFLEGWHNAYDKHVKGHDSEGPNAFEEIFGPYFYQPGWISELSQIHLTSFPEVMYQITGSVENEII